MKRRHSNAAGGSRAGAFGKARVLVGSRITEVVPPTPRPGQVSCPVCRKATTVNQRGTLRKHRDLFGNPCYATAATPVHLDQIPDVELPPERTVRRSPKDYKPTTPRKRGAWIVTGRCHACDTPVSGERRLCGICLATGRRP